MNSVDPSGMDSCSSSNNYCGLGAPGVSPTKNPAAYQNYINQQMYAGGDLAYGWTDPFQVMQTPSGYTLSAPENGTLIPVYGNAIFDYSGGSSSGSTAGPGGASQQPPNSRPTFTKTYLPGDLYQICAVGRTSFPAPFKFDITKIEAAGQANGLNPFAANANVGQYGTFDFQRSRDSSGNTAFYSGFTPVSNFSVGAYMQSAGYSRLLTSAIANGFALLRSSNFGDPAQALYRNLGYDTAAKGQTPFCMNPD